MCGAPQTNERTTFTWPFAVHTQPYSTWRLTVAPGKPEPDAHCTAQRCMSRYRLTPIYRAPSVTPGCYTIFIQPSKGERCAGRCARRAASEQGARNVEPAGLSSFTLHCTFHCTFPAPRLCTRKALSWLYASLRFAFPIRPTDGRNGRNGTHPPAGRLFDDRATLYGRIVRVRAKRR